jgi:hypothetical protein
MGVDTIGKPERGIARPRSGFLFMRLGWISDYLLSSDRCFSAESVAKRSFMQYINIGDGKRI